MAGDDGDQNTSPSKMEQIKSTVIEYINYPAWSNADKQKLNKRLLFYIPFYAFIAGLWFLWVTAFHASALAKTDGKFKVGFRFFRFLKTRFYDNF